MCDFINVVCNKYFESKNISHYYLECVQYIFDNWSIERIRKTKFKHVSKLNTVFITDPEKIMLFLEIYNIIPDHTEIAGYYCYKNFKCELFRNDYEKVEINDYEIDELNLKAENYKEAQYLQRYCLSQNKYFLYIADYVDIVKFSMASLGKNTTLCVTDEKEANLFIEIFGRCQHKALFEIHCSDLSLIRAIENNILSIIEERYSNDSSIIAYTNLKKSKAKIKVNLLKNQLILKYVKISYWFVDQEDEYYHSLLKNKIPITIACNKALCYLFKNNKIRKKQYHAMTCENILYLRSLGYNKNHDWDKTMKILDKLIKETSL